MENLNTIPTAEEFLKEYELGNTGKIDIAAFTITK